MPQPRPLLKSIIPAILCICSAIALAHDPVGNFTNSIDRPIRYHPDAGDFVIDNGTIEFNRPLYTAHTGSRVEAGDRPEFAFCLPGKGGVLRLGISINRGALWLIDCKQIQTRYHAGSLVYDIDDPIMGPDHLRITALPTLQTPGLALRADFQGNDPLTLLWAYGGGTGQRIRTRFDLIDSADPAQIWNLRPEDCTDATIQIQPNSFTYTNRAGTLTGVGPEGSTVSIADAAQWNSLADLLKPAASAQKIAVGRSALSIQPAFFSFRWNVRSSPVTRPADLFDQSQQYRQSVANRITIDTPDPYINAIPAALCIAADNLWEPPTVMHGNNAWRVPLLGWRGPYCLDALSWHDRAEAHLSHWASLQNTDPVIPTTARADEKKNLAENDWVMLHSNGNIPQTHYDMNLAFIDALFRHLLWTGDLDFARKMWPVIVRHLAWEKRCFDRDGLYEGYACIWASDGLEYNGGGAAHSSAYNYLHNLMAAKLARLIGQDPAPYDAEAARIHDAMQKQLWLPDRGWYAEYKDLRGLQRVHPDAALWTVYHVIDCGVPDNFQAWQTLRYVDTHIAHIPVRGPGVPDGNFFVLPTSDWLPYEWSLNNVCMAENMHTALAYWQANRPDTAFDIFKGITLDAMYMGICPGDFPNLSYHDAYRGESYRDFGDTIGITSRALIEGLFGIQPDALAGILTLRPGFPADWPHASIQTPDLSYQFTRTGNTDRYLIEPHCPKPMSLRLIRPAATDHPEVQLNGQPIVWKNLPNSVGSPQIEIDAPAAEKFEVTIVWSGASIAETPTHSPDQNHPAFAHETSGDVSWWLPIDLKSPTAISPAPGTPGEGRGGGSPSPTPTDSPPPTHSDTIDLTPFFNDKVTRIFQNAYLSPRTPYCSLQIPKQGIGNWTSFNQTPKIDDTGLRHAAGPAGTLVLPNGLQFRTPTNPAAKNIAFTSQWDNYPHEITIPLTGSVHHAFLLMAGSTNPMETHIDNGEIIVTYTDSTTLRVPLTNPVNWWPIEQDYFTDDFAFKRPGPIPLRICLGTGQPYYPHNGPRPPGGTATVIDFSLDASRQLKSLTVRTLSNTVVIGLMSLTLER